MSTDIEGTLLREFQTTVARAQKLYTALKALGVTTPFAKDAVKLIEAASKPAAVKQAAPRTAKRTRHGERSKVTLDALTTVHQPVSINDFLRNGPAKGSRADEFKRWRNAVYNIAARLGDSSPVSVRNGVIYPVKSAT